MMKPLNQNKMVGTLIKSYKHYSLWDDDKKCIANTINPDGFDYKLSIKNCQAIERGYDLDELADEFAKTKSSHSTFQNTHKRDFCAGFQKAIELMEHRLSKETEWQVEVVMDICGDRVYAVPEPKLDADGCLILKRI